MVAERRAASAVAERPAVRGRSPGPRAARRRSARPTVRAPHRTAPRRSRPSRGRAASPGPACGARRLRPLPGSRTRGPPAPRSSSPPPAWTPTAGARAPRPCRRRRRWRGARTRGRHARPGARDAPVRRRPRRPSSRSRRAAAVRGPPRGIQPWARVYGLDNRVVDSATFRQPWLSIERRVDMPSDRRQRDRAALRHGLRRRMGYDRACIARPRGHPGDPLAGCRAAFTRAHPTPHSSGITGATGRHPARPALRSTGRLAAAGLYRSALVGGGRRASGGGPASRASASAARVATSRRSRSPRFLEVRASP